MPVLIVALLTFVSWGGLLSQTFIKEGFMYFSDNHLACAAGIKGLITGLSRYDFFPRLIFVILPNFFADNLQLYILLMFLMITLGNVIFYLLVYEFTGRRIIALLASIFFVVNYVSLYELIGTGQYQWLAQRTPNFILIFLSFIFFVRYLKGKTGLRGYGLAVVLYFLAVLMSHYSLYFLPMFIFYAIFSRRLFSSIFLALPFFLVSFLLVWLDKNFGCGSLLPNSSFFHFILSHEDLIEDVAYQLPIITLPNQVLRLFTETHLRLIVIGLSIPVSAFYLIAVVWLYFKEKGLRPAMLSSFLFMVIALILNVYIRGSEVRYIYETSRYFHVALIGLSIFLAILFYSLFYRRGILGKVILSLLIFGWIVTNTGSIWKTMVKDQGRHFANKIILSYFKNNLPRFPENAFVVGPYIIDGYAASFYRLFYGSEQMIITPIYTDWENRLEKNFDLERLFVLDYDYERGEIVDKSVEFRRLISTGSDLREEKKFEAEKAKFIEK